MDDLQGAIGGTEYWLIHTIPTDEKGMRQRPGVNSPIIPKTTTTKTRHPSQLHQYRKLDEYTKKVEEQGGKILMSKQQVPTVGWIEVEQDPEGNQFGLLQPEMPQDARLQ